MCRGGSAVLASGPCFGRLDAAAGLGVRGPKARVPVSHASQSRGANGDHFLFCASFLVSSCSPAGIDARQAVGANGASMSWASFPSRWASLLVDWASAGGCLASTPWEAGQSGASEQQRVMVHQPCKRPALGSPTRRRRVCLGAGFGAPERACGVFLPCRDPPRVGGAIEPWRGHGKPW